MCARCGMAAVWTVRLDGGEVVGAGDGREAFMVPGLGRAGLRIRQEALDAAGRADFKALPREVGRPRQTLEMIPSEARITWTPPAGLDAREALRLEPPHDGRPD
jgi:hypothetical protein